MDEALLIHCSAQETRVALMVNGILEDLHIERRAQRGLVGNVYKGKVMRVLPGMQSAFVEIGLERTAFLHVHVVQPDAQPGNNPLKNAGRYSSRAPACHAVYYKP